MECDNPKVYKDTSIFDGLVVNVIIMLIDVDLDEGRMAVPNRINFRKSSKQPLNPPPHFQKIMLQFFLGKFSQEALFTGRQGGIKCAN